MQRIVVLLFLLLRSVCIGQQSDFASISFVKADRIAKETKSRRLYELNKLTLQLTKDLDTDVEKVRAIYKWICINVASDFQLYHKNKRLRKKYKKDSVKLAAWNSELKRDLFEKLLKRKKTICTGYAYLFKEMCDIVNIECKMVYGFGRTADVTEFDPAYPNHTWNAVQLNNKWYLCDATWAAGTAYQDRFKFSYNDGYFLTNPELFLYNHFPIDKKFFLVDNPPTFQQFVQMPLLYGKAYEVLEKHDKPTVLHHEIKLNNSFAITYHLKKNIDTTKLKMVLFNGRVDKTVTPRISLEKDVLHVTYKFPKIGFYDVHIYLNKAIIATYTVHITG